MTCRGFGGVIACGPPGVYRRLIRHCPTCERRRRFVESWDGAWYGTTLYCACGDRWMDGELCPRPFEKGWRAQAQESFRARWKFAASPANYNRYVSADITFATGRGRQWKKASRKRAVALELIRRERVA